MIDAIERQNNTRESIKSTARLIELLDDLQLIKYASFTREIISSSSIYSERSRFQKILDSSLFTDEKNSI